MNARLPSTRGFRRRDFLQLLGVGAAVATLGPRMVTAAAPGAAVAPAIGARKQFRGLFPIGTTPCTADNQIDYESLAAQVGFCNRGGVHGFVWPQIASGWSALTEPERLQGAEAILTAGKGGRTTLAIGVQSKTGDLAEVKRYAAHAGEHGADALVCLPPSTMTDEKALLDYYQQVGRVSELPLFIQSVGNMSVDLVVEIHRTVPTAKFVKDEAAAGGGPLHRITELRRRTNDSLTVFSGQGVRTMITEMELGFLGHCPYVALADVYAAAFDLWHAGRKPEAFDMFGRVLAFASLGANDATAILIARGVFKPGVHARTIPESGGGGGAARGGPPALNEAQIRDALQNYLKPWLRA